VWDTDGGVYFGYGTGATESAGRPALGPEIRYVGDRHLMTIGPNGSGKSRRVLLPNLALLKGWSVVVVDPKGELFQMVAEYRDAGLKNSLVLNPFRVLINRSDGFNPVAALDPSSDDFPDDALTLAEALIRMEGKDPHWAASAQDLMAALIMFSRLSQPDGGSLAHVRDILGRPLGVLAQTMTLLIAVAKNKKCPELETKGARFIDLSPESRELSSIVSTALTQTRWLDSRPLKADLSSDHDYDFGQLKDVPTSIWLILPARRLGTHSTWMRLMIAAILQPLLKDTRKAKVPVLLMLDEYPALAEGGFPIIERNMAMFRGYGVKLWTVFQDLSQAKRLYGDHWESFAANAGVLQSFAPQDLTTADYLSKRMPLTAMSAEAQNRSFGDQSDKPSSSHSSNVSEKGMPLMLPQHLRNMDEGISVIFSHKTKGPIRSYLPWKVKGLEDVYARDPA
jgi:type IV secretion system protein VirD4